MEEVIVDKYATHLLSRLRKLHEEDELCDATLKSRGGITKIHGLVSAGASDVLYAHAKVAARDQTCTFDIDLGDCSSVIRECIASFLYTGVLCYPKDSTEELVQTLSILGLTDALKAVTQHKNVPERRISSRLERKLKAQEKQELTETSGKLVGNQTTLVLLAAKREITDRDYSNGPLTSENRRSSLRVRRKTAKAQDETPEVSPKKARRAGRCRKLSGSVNLSRIKSTQLSENSMGKF